MPHISVSRVKTWLRTTAVAAVAMVLAAGCLDAKMDFAVNSDGSGSVNLEASISQQLWEITTAFQEADSDLSDEDVCQEIWGGEIAGEPPFGGLSNVGAGLELDEQVFADDENCRYTARAAWSAAQSELAFGFFRADGGPIIERVGSNGWSFDLPFETGEVDFDELDFAFAEVMDISFVINATLPGSPVEHNADEVSTGCNTSTFSWDVDLFDPPVLLFAVTDGEGDCEEGWGAGPTVAVVLLGVLVVLVAAAAAIRRRRSDSVLEPSEQS